MLAENKCNRNLPQTLKVQAQLHSQSGKKGRLFKTNNLKTLGKKRAFWIDVLK